MPLRNIMSAFKRIAEGAAEQKEDARKKAKIQQEPLYAQYTTTSLRLCGDDVLAPLKLLPHTGDSDVLARHVPVPGPVSWNCSPVIMSLRAVRVRGVFCPVSPSGCVNVNVL